MADIDFQQLSTVQNLKTQTPITLASAATLVPITFLTRITGTTAVSTITPPIDGCHMLAIVTAVTNHSGFTTTGNIAAASLTNSTVWSEKTSFFVYDPRTKKYQPNYAVATTN